MPYVRIEITGRRDGRAEAADLSKSTTDVLVKVLNKNPDATWSCVIDEIDNQELGPHGHLRDQDPRAEAKTRRPAAESQGRPEPAKPRRPRPKSPTKKA